jgi:hypothetical protein
MDAALIQQLEAAGLEPDPLSLSLGVMREGTRLVAASGPQLVVGGKDRSAEVELKPLSALFTGTSQPPAFRGEPPPGYMPFFLLVETTAALGCEVRERPEVDEEFERLYRQLRRRPDGTDANPLFSYLQRAAQLYLSLRDTSRAEYEAVMDRLSKSARTFHTHTGSTNYWTHALRPLLEAMQ